VAGDETDLGSLFLVCLFLVVFVFVVFVVSLCVLCCVVLCCCVAAWQVKSYDRAAQRILFGRGGFHGGAPHMVRVASKL
jgi:hypothetical protein